MEWFYSRLAGIQQTADSKGYRHILINPGVVGDITWVDAAYKSINGEITCKWKIDNGNFSLDVIIPGNTTATIVFPNADPGKIADGVTPIATSASIKNIHVDGNKTYFDIPSGKYYLVSVKDK